MVERDGSRGRRAGLPGTSVPLEAATATAGYAFNGIVFGQRARRAGGSGGASPQHNGENPIMPSSKKGGNYGIFKNPIERTP